MQWVSTSYAPEILREAGKTISDSDRKRVDDLVGAIKLLNDPVTIAARVNQLHRFIIQAQRAKLAEGYERVNAFSGGREVPQLTKEQKAELAELRKQIDSLSDK